MFPVAGRLLNSHAILVKGNLIGRGRLSDIGYDVGNGRVDIHRSADRRPVVGRPPADRQLGPSLLQFLLRCSQAMLLKRRQLFEKLCEQTLRFLGLEAVKHSEKFIASRWSLLLCMSVCLYNRYVHHVALQYMVCSAMR